MLLAKFYVIQITKGEKNIYDLPSFNLTVTKAFADFPCPGYILIYYLLVLDIESVHEMHKFSKHVLLVNPYDIQATNEITLTITK